MKPGLSVYLIAGREEASIGRCLDSLKPVADEIVVCLARGGQEPDRTEGIARQKGARVVCYQNAPQNAAWPHVDDFAAARNTALDACRHEWRMWIDADDILPAHAHQILRHIADNKAPEVDVWMFPYDVRNASQRPIRERVARAGKARWQNAIHETWQPVEGATLKAVDCAFPVHAPDLTRPHKKNERNIRILGSQLLRSAHNAYYLAQEYFNTHTYDLAEKWCKAVLAMPHVDATLEWEVRFILGRIPTVPAEARVEHLARAWALMPDRIEAPFALSVEAANAGDWERAYFFGSTAYRMPPPKTLYWSSIHFIRNWHAADHLALCCRTSGRTEEAKALEDAFPSPTIVLLHPTRNRFSKAINNRLRWFSMATHPERVEHIFGIDADDKDFDAFKPYRHAVSPSTGHGAAVNAAAAVSRGKVFVVISDDFEPFPGWDDALLAKIPEDRQGKPWVMAVNDCVRTDILMTIQVLSRELYEQRGWVMCPEYVGIYNDTDFTARAYKEGLVIEARDLRFRHVHPIVHKDVEWDETYKRSNAHQRYVDGRKTFLKHHPEPEWACYAPDPGPDPAEKKLSEAVDAAHPA